MARFVRRLQRYNGVEQPKAVGPVGLAKVPCDVSRAGFVAEAVARQVVHGL